jgi:GNAT superfamily N-acetyltransferase
MLSLVDRLSNRGDAGSVNRTQECGAGSRAAIVVRRADRLDLSLLAEFFEGLSTLTRYRRFFAAITPTPAMLDSLAGGSGTIDALVAWCGATIVGHAMAADRAGPDSVITTDIGVVVADAWQGSGVGSALMRTLVNRAQARGVASMTMDVMHGNRDVIAMIAGHWPAARTSYTSDGVTVTVRFPGQRPQVRTHFPASSRAPAMLSSA